MWDATLSVCGIRPDAELTRDERGKFNAAVKQLRDVGATPAEVSRRARVYRDTWPKITLTPNALAANWSLLAAEIRSRPTAPQAWDVIGRRRDARTATGGNR